MIRTATLAILASTALAAFSAAAADAPATPMNGTVPGRKFLNSFQDGPEGRGGGGIVKVDQRNLLAVGQGDRHI